LSAVQRTPALGRAGALGRLEGKFDAARTAELAVATVTGEPGIRKTRVLGELAARLADRGTVVLYGRASAHPSPPYEPVLQALGHYLVSARPADLAAMRAIDPPMLARLLPELHVGVGATPLLSADDESGGRRRAFAALTGALEAIAGSSAVLLALDDMHWADSETMELLSHLVPNVGAAPIMVVLAYRDAEPILGIHRMLDAAERRAAVERVSLSPLTEHEVAALVDAWAGTGAPRSLTWGSTSAATATLCSSASFSGTWCGCHRRAWRALGVRGRDWGARNTSRDRRAHRTTCRAAR
jgi:predicted ATPase